MSGSPENRRDDPERSKGQFPRISAGFIDYLGEECVGFGSDFDGAMMPKKLSSVLGMRLLIELMVNQGFSEDLMKKLCHQNWLSLIKRTLT